MSILFYDMTQPSKISVNSGVLGQKLARLHDPPKKLYLRGRLKVDQPLVALVGSRKCSNYGADLTTQLAKSLAKNGVGVISGLAFGIDSHAHKGTLAAHGYTVAVLPSGVDQIYPATHTNLANDIVKSGGALVSEYANGANIMKYQFIARNRIIAALADAVVITEAALKSGSLSTAEFALNMGIPVMAVPGQITSPTSAGTNKLIQMGAGLVSRVDDILEEIGLDQPEAPERYTSSNPAEAKILSILSQGPMLFDDICLMAKMAPNQLARHLTHLEMDDLIRNDGGNGWLLK